MKENKRDHEDRGGGDLFDELGDEPFFLRKEEKTQLTSNPPLLAVYRSVYVTLYLLAVDRRLTDVRLRARTNMRPLACCAERVEFYL